MHYKNGREAHDGEPVVAKNPYGTQQVIAGVLHSTNAAGTSCNGQIAYPIPGGSANWCVTVGEIYHAQDALLAVEAATDSAQVKTDAAPA